jgi:hypothetical protein
VRGSAGPRRFHVTAPPAVLRELREVLAVAAAEARAERRHARARACLDAVALIDITLSETRSLTPPPARAIVAVP